MNTQQPIFQSVFAEQWPSLPPVMHTHYANRPYSTDVITVTGLMEVKFSPLIKLLSPVLRLFGSLVPYEGKDIPVTVHFRSEPNSAAFCLERRFHFPDKKPYLFYSKMIQIKDNVLIEYMKHGLGWKHRYSFVNNKVLLRHCAYVWRLFGIHLRLPLEWVFGRGSAEEEALDDRRFRMQMTIDHVWFGRMYEYRGEFEVADE